MQNVIRKWVMETFGEDMLRDREERALRVLEEALELVQAMGLSKEKCDLMLSYVFARDRGEVRQELAGLHVCLYAAAAGMGYDLIDCTLEELNRIRDPKVQEKCRQKQAAKYIIGVGNYQGEEESPIN